jgi:hypothetical protein
VVFYLRLNDSLPPNRRFPKQVMTSGRAFAAFDRLLDDACSGATYLRNPAVAEVVLASILRGADELRHYDRNAWVVIPNHVHLLITR